MKFCIFILRCSSFIYRATIWSDNYQLSLPTGSITVLTAHTSRTAAEENDKEQLFDNMNTPCLKKVTAFSVLLSDKMAPTQVNAYKRHTVWQYVLWCIWQCTCAVCSEHKPQSAALIHTVSLTSHHFHKVVERCFIIVEDQNILTCIHKLEIKLQITGCVLQVSTLYTGVLASP
jgi:hypothetical protein